MGEHQKAGAIRVCGLVNLVAIALLCLGAPQDGGSAFPIPEGISSRAVHTLPILVIHTNIPGLTKTNRVVTSLSFAADQARTSRRELAEISSWCIGVTSKRSILLKNLR